MLISIIVPVYNLEKYIAQCLESVLKQTFKEFEIIVIDDGSIDNSSQVIKKYQKKDKRVKYFYQENKGLSKARNTGLEKSAGEYIIFLDGDDFWLKIDFLDKIKKLINQSSPECIIFKSIKFYEKLNIYEKNKNKFDYSLLDKKSIKEVFNILNVNKQPIACAWNKCIKKDVLIKNNIKFIEGITAEDIDWNIKLFLNLEKIAGLNDIVHSYRQQRKGAITTQFNEKRIRDVFYNIKSWANKQGDLNKEINSFLAFHYTALLLQISNIKNKELLYEIKEYDFLFKYSADKRTKVIGVIYKILGIRITAKLLKMIYDLKNN